MIVGSVGWAIAGLVMISNPENAISYLGLTSDVNTLWVFRISGLIVLAFAVHMGTTSRYAADRPFRRTALFMVLFEIAIAVLTYSAPGEFTSGRWVVVISGALFALLYLITLPIKSIGYKEGELSNS
jgi:hypothetical protein